jgi:dTDP-4-dehydrorhamnose 3,5-epimerase/CDP-3, 6-dideoxy-D-glycero-D-glycero-4-hexulose-5-epimerase
MELVETNINGILILKSPVFKDSRGSFQKVVDWGVFNTEIIDCNFKEIYFSKSNKNVIRGMHFQNPPYDCAKIIYVNAGSIIDVGLDIRANSKTFGKWFSMKLNAHDGNYLYLPSGIAHGFFSLENDTIVNYIQTAYYSKECDMGIRFDSFGFNWDIDKPIISLRDSNFLSFEEFKKDNPFL